MHCFQSSSNTSPVSAASDRALRLIVLREEERSSTFFPPTEVRPQRPDSAPQMRAIAGADHGLAHSSSAPLLLSIALREISNSPLYVAVEKILSGDTVTSLIAVPIAKAMEFVFSPQNALAHLFSEFNSSGIAEQAGLVRDKFGDQGIQAEPLQYDIVRFLVGVLTVRHSQQSLRFTIESVFDTVINEKVENENGAVQDLFDKVSETYPDAFIPVLRLMTEQLAGTGLDWIWNIDGNNDFYFLMSVLQDDVHNYCNDKSVDACSLFEVAGYEHDVELKILSLNDLDMMGITARRDHDSQGIQPPYLAPESLADEPRANEPSRHAPASSAYVPGTDAPVHHRYAEICRRMRTFCRSGGPTFVPEQKCEVKASPKHGLGVFATRDIKKGELITLYPADGVVLRLCGSTCRFLQEFDGMREGLCLAGVYSAMAPCFGRDVILVGNPNEITDPLYLGHMANDSCRLTSLEQAQVYMAASKAGRNAEIGMAPFCANAPGKHHLAQCIAVWAMRDIAFGDEVLVPYGVQYWLETRHALNSPAASTVLEASLIE